jgi:hypothetical protein
VIWPQRVRQLLATDVPSAVEHQIGEQQPSLLAAQPVRELSTVELDGQAAAELDTGAVAAGPAPGNVLETYRQRQRGIVPPMDTGANNNNNGALGGAQEVTTSTATKEGQLRIAYCECGAQLAGSSEQELFDAAQRHLAHHHPQLLGALGPDVVQKMAENVGG